MRIALVAPPFISVPPAQYGGTELFIAQLALGLKQLGLDVVVYANGESKLDCEVRWLYPRSEWPIQGEVYGSIKDMNHCAWAIRDAWDDADVIHVNNVPGLLFSRFQGPKFVYTIHHKHDEALSQFYSHYPQVNYVAISRFQQGKEQMPRIRTVHHGVDMSKYRLSTAKREYLCFLGRIAPLKGTHNAIAVAKRAGIPLKIAGEVQPMYREYYESQIKPHVDGKFIEYVGPVDLRGKNDLLENSMALLFPIEWDEPFGLVMIEAMATGTPVLAFKGGSVEEIVRPGVSGMICGSVEDMARQASELEGRFPPERVREYANELFSVERMVHDYANCYLEVTDEEGPSATQTNFRFTSKLPVALPASSLDDADPLVDDPEDPRAIA